MTGWAEGPFLGLDTETTGVTPAVDRIVTAALVHRDRSGTRVRAWLLDPGVPIPDAASAIHGVTTERVRREGRRPAEALAEIAGIVAEATRAAVPLVAFNAAFDLTVLEAELVRHGLPGLRAHLGRPVGPVLDPLVLDRALERHRPGTRRLVDLCARYGLVPGGALHTAEVDVVATLDVLAAIARRHPAITAMPPDQLHAWQAVAHRSWAEGYARWRRSQGGDARPPSPHWPLAPDPGSGPRPPSEISGGSSWAPRRSSGRRAGGTP
jgi:DNA polymerase-3 subunit epsilon